jgi:hypothetical protein
VFIELMNPYCCDDAWFLLQIPNQLKTVQFPGTWQCCLNTSG